MNESEWDLLLVEATQEMAVLRFRAKSIKKIKRKSNLKRKLKKYRITN
jgi:hypothetical protein